MNDHARHGHLPRLAPEYYRGMAVVHWVMTVDDRRTGWLTPHFHAQGHCCPESGLLLFSNIRLKAPLQRYRPVLHFEFARICWAMMSRIYSDHGHSDCLRSSALTRSPRGVSSLRRALSW